MAVFFIYAKHFSFDSIKYSAELSQLQKVKLNIYIIKVTIQEFNSYTNLSKLANYCF